MYNLDIPRHTWSLGVLLERLGDDFIFPCLHTLHLRGNFDLDWDEFFCEDDEDDEDEDGDLHPLRAFFSRHPGIQNLAIGWAPETSPMNESEIEPDEVAGLFPALKHFEGPAFLCKVLLSSHLAPRLESLTVVDTTLDQELGDSQLSGLLDSSPKLDSLSRLSIWAELDLKFGIDIETVKELAVAAFALEELEIRSKPHDYESFMDMLRELPLLRRLSLDEAVLDMFTEDEDAEDEGEDDGDNEEEEDGESDEESDEDQDDVKEDNNGMGKVFGKAESDNNEKDDNPEQQEWVRFVMTLARVSPRLEHVRSHQGARSYNVWRIVRNAGKVTGAMREPEDHWGFYQSY